MSLGSWNASNDLVDFILTSLLKECANLPDLLMHIINLSIDTIYLHVRVAAQGGRVNWEKRGGAYNKYTTKFKAKIATFCTQELANRELRLCSYSEDRVW